MNFEILELEPILNYVELVTLIPKRGTKDFRRYRKLYLDLIEAVPNTAGIYLWIGPDCKRTCRYVGISVEGFQQRFKNEFQQEYSVHWETVHGEDPTISLACQHYPCWSSKIKSQSYRGKAGTRFIIYHEIVNRTETELRELEAELIQHCNPVANEIRPEPTGDLHDEALLITKGFKKAILDYLNNNSLQ